MTEAFRVRQILRRCAESYRRSCVICETIALGCGLFIGFFAIVSPFSWAFFISYPIWLGSLLLAFAVTLAIEHFSKTDDWPEILGLPFAALAYLSPSLSGSFSSCVSTPPLAAHKGGTFERS